MFVLDKSAVILALDSSTKFDEDKGLIKLDNKPLLNHVLDAVACIVNESIVVVGSKEQADAYAKIAPDDVRFEVSSSTEPLEAALKGFEASQGKYTLLLPFDAPFVSGEIVSLFFDLCVGKSAVIARTPDNEVEALQAVFDTEQAVAAAKAALEDGEVEVEALVSRLRGVRFISTMVIEQMDPDFRTFFR